MSGLLWFAAGWMLFGTLVSLITRRPESGTVASGIGFAIAVCGNFAAFFTVAYAATRGLA